jgi:hypothetical protein
LADLSIGSNGFGLPMKECMNRPTKVIKTLAQRLGNLSLNCKEAARLQSAALDRKLTPLEWLGLCCHLVLCKWCCRYGSQIKFLRSAAGERSQDDQHQYACPQVLSPVARERIKKRLRSEKD